MEERRHFERTDANCTVEIALPKGWRRVRIATLLEVSEGGGLLKGDLGCSVGTELSVRLWFPDLSDLLCTGVVRSARADRSFGVEWTNISPQNGDRLAEYVQCPPARHANQWQSGQPAEPPEDGNATHMRPLSRARRHKVTHVARFSGPVCGAPTAATPHAPGESDPPSHGRYGG